MELMFTYKIYLFHIHPDAHSLKVFSQNIFNNVLYQANFHDVEFSTCDFQVNAQKVSDTSISDCRRGIFNLYLNL